MPPRSRATESFCQRPSDNTRDTKADMNRHRTDQRRANLDKIARYIIRPLSQSSDRHVGMDFLKHYGIRCYDMDLKTGQVSKRAEPYIQLIQPQVIEQWLREIRSPSLKDRRDFVNEFSHEFGDSPLLINRLGKKNTNWQLKALLRQHLPNPSRYDRIPNSQKPHVMYYLADKAQLVDNKLLTSELTALLVVTADTALKATWQKQKIIPVRDRI
ncbi:1-phosphatidylinositol-4,5-bisphosphate phosphodiesterase 1 [Fusarium circinatum]|uniref:1-phosphatidylinositol-4,5-bisphosphate phosphodiesterase 1 n=1 Tax=Fusarium circinatum TaxID=48490 RepID=A0A8H5X988_FUSCI|nr:1-phosphatidylinositol-4,5-bisphosphate phosphodiesterase 1 [Fusarium circinatum]